MSQFVRKEVVEEKLYDVFDVCCEDFQAASKNRDRVAKKKPLKPPSKSVTLEEFLKDLMAKPLASIDKPIDKPLKLISR